jgi:hypothetical protein
MRDLVDIDRDIHRIVDCLSALIIEKRLTEQVLAGFKVSAEIISEKLIERAKRHD